MSKEERVARPGGADWPMSALRIGFGLIWAIDAMFKWRASFREGFLATVQGAAQGQPLWLHGWFHFWIGVIAPHPQLWDYLTAITETILALALIVGFARKSTYIVTALYALGVWAVAEGFGGPYNSASTDIGTAIMYALVALALLAMSSQRAATKLSLDYLLERHLPWWPRVAEVGAVAPHPR